jgi:hypothetical protein
MKIFEEVETYISGQFNSIKMLLTLIKLEAKLAGLTIVPLLINICMLFVILITFWLSAMMLLGYFILMTSNNFWIAIGVIITLNLLILGALLKYLTFNLKAMSFQKTRLYFTKPESNEHEKLENTADCSNK